MTNTELFEAILMVDEEIEGALLEGNDEAMAEANAELNELMAILAERNLEAEFEAYAEEM